MKPGTAGSNARAKASSSCSTPREMERTASESRMVLGMWVKFTKRTRPMHCPPKGTKTVFEPVVEEVESDVEESNSVPSTPGKSPSMNRFATSLRGPRKKGRKTVRKGIVVMDNVASLEEQEEVQPLDLDTEVFILPFFLFCNI